MRSRANGSLILALILCCLTISTNAEPLKDGKTGNAWPNEFLNVASIGYKHDGDNLEQYQFCTGTMITWKHVITAAHCFFGKTKTEVQVLLGSRNLKSCSKIDIGSWITYEEWLFQNHKVSDNKDRNIGIITLSSPFGGLKVKPAILLLDDIPNLFGSRVSLAGWGIMKDGSSPKTLQVANSIILPNEQCQQHESLLSLRPTIFNGKYYCTKAPPFFTCGDDGGPLFLKQKVLIALNQGLCVESKQSHPAQLNTHLRIAPFKEFIFDIVKEEEGQELKLFVPVH
ncbi:hypothetical protein QAD02_011400 [Eretmocerus hayati]|uniref:Uncharacterized protein n=1 Tax=Eretmocerus hayati TaxID=131215 RepID=A0ACC2NX34_9HYME|nr:hypothetical protein QAD02_011400 [Eretmocerus hayati]